MGLLTFTENDTRLDINTSQTTPEITASETVENAADIKINGYEFVVSEDGDFADVQVKPLEIHNVYTSGNVVEQAPADFEVGQTVKDAIGALTPTLIRSFTSPPVTADGYAMSFDYFYFLRDETLYRISLLDYSEETFVIDGSLGITLGDHNTIYAVYQRLVGIDYHYGISKIDFCDSTETMVHSTSQYFSYGGNDYTLVDYIFISKVFYDDVEYIVAGFNCQPDDSSNGYAIKFVIHNITENSITETNPINLNDSYALRNNFNYCTSPKVYNGNLVITLYPTGFNGTPPSPKPSICMFPTFIVDCPNDTVHRVIDYTFDSDIIWAVALFGSGIDQAPNDYYFWLSSVDESGSGALMKIDIDSRITYKLGGFSDSDVRILQGDTKPYGIKLTGDATRPILVIPNLTWRGSIHDTYGCYIVDEKNQKIWVFDDTSSPVIEGGATVYASTQNLSITGWLTTPFTYSYDQRVKILMIAGKIFLVLTSSHFEDPLYQMDIYELKKAISCS